MLPLHLHVNQKSNDDDDDDDNDDIILTPKDDDADDLMFYIPFNILSHTQPTEGMIMKGSVQLSVVQSRE